MLSIESVTSLGDLSSAHGFPRGGVLPHCANNAGFQPAEPRSSGLPIDKSLRCAVRHRLRFHLPPSPRGPFMVKLFTAGRLNRSPGQILGPVARITANKLPTAARVERGRRPQIPPWRITQRTGIASPAASPALSMTARMLAHTSLSRSPGFPPECPKYNQGGSTRTKWGRGHRIEATDCILGLCSPGFYSQQPPSNRTSTSPCIRLYAPPTMRGMNPASLQIAGEAILLGIGVCVWTPKRSAVASLASRRNSPPAPR